MKSPAATPIPELPPHARNQALPPSGGSPPAPAAPPADKIQAAPTTGGGLVPADFYAPMVEVEVTPITPRTVTPDSVVVAESEPSTPRALTLPKRAQGESDDAWARYSFWLALADRPGQRRTYAAVARWAGVDESVIRTQSARYGWLERGLQADRVRTVKAAAVVGSLQAEAVSQHIVLASMLCEQASVMLQKAEEMQDLDPEMWTNIAAKTAKILKDASGVARLSCGLATVRVEGDATKAPKLDMGRLTMEELRLMAAGQALEVIANPKSDERDVRRARTEVAEMLSEIRK